jgi:hypothetical protein
MNRKQRREDLGAGASVMADQKNKKDDMSIEHRKQVLYWRLLATVFEQEEAAPTLETLAGKIATEEGLPTSLLDGRVAIETLTQRYPELGAEFDNLYPGGEEEDSEQRFQDGGYDDPHDERSLRRALLLSKLMLNVFGPNANHEVMTADGYNQWLKDVGAMEKAFGSNPGDLRSGRKSLRPGDMAPDGSGGPGQGFDITNEELSETLKGMEKDIIKRMALREVLKDSKLAAKITPSMPLVEQLLRDKSNLSGVALENAKMLIKRYVDELAEVLKLEVEKAKTGEVDHSVPPKRVFRNLDLKRTIWKNLTNWDPKEKRLYVDHLYYKHTAQYKMANQLIVVVDQSGSMLDSMVNCAILASIFAGLPRVEAHLIAYDTRMIDLTEYVHDPFEVLLRTNLGGGNDWRVAMEPVKAKIREPRHTAVVWISDFYEIYIEQLLAECKALKESGVHFMPVGSVTSTGYFSVNQWFKQHFKEMGTPVISGSVNKLIKEIKEFVG